MSNDLSRQPELDELESLLAQMIPLHEQLLSCAMEKRGAVKAAAISAVPEICQRERQLLSRIERLEQRRRNVVRKLGDERRSLADLAALAATEQRDRLTAFGARLRELSKSVRQESTVVRAAVEALHRHMTGVVQSVSTAISGVKVYGATGRMRTDAPLESCVDLTS